MHRLDIVAHAASTKFSFVKTGSNCLSDSHSILGSLAIIYLQYVMICADEPIEEKLNFMLVYSKQLLPFDVTMMVLHGFDS